MGNRQRDTAGFLNGAGRCSLITAALILQPLALGCEQLLGLDQYQYVGSQSQTVEAEPGEPGAIVFGTESSDTAENVAISGDDIFVVGTTTGTFDGTPGAGSSDAYLATFDVDAVPGYAVTWGTAQRDTAAGVAVGPAGELFIAGTTNGLLGEREFGESDAYLTKRDANGDEQWTVQWGTAAVDEASGVAVGADGSIFVVGVSFSMLGTVPALGDGDAFVSKFESDGTLAWTQQWGTALADEATAVVADGNGIIYVAGNTSGGIQNNTSNGEVDMFLARIDEATGSLLWIGQFGGAAFDYARAVTVDLRGDAFLAGTSGKNVDGTGGNGTLVKWLIDGKIKFSVHWGTAADTGNLGVSGNGVYVDAEGTIFVAGEVGGDLAGGVSAGASDAFLVSFSPEGKRRATSQWGSNKDDRATGLAASGAELIVVGTATGALGAAAQVGGSDVFVSKRGPDTSAKWIVE